MKNYANEEISYRGCPGCAYAKHEFEKTGERQLGGLYGFAGNTYKIVKDSESSSGFSLLGSNYYEIGYDCPLTGVGRDIGPSITRYTSVGLLELTK